MLVPKGCFPFEISKGPSASWDLGGENSKTGQFVLMGEEETEISPAFSLRAAGRSPGVRPWLWGWMQEGDSEGDTLASWVCVSPSCLLNNKNTRFAHSSAFLGGQS